MVAADASDRAQVAHLAGLDQFGHGADRVLDRHGLVDAVLEVEIDEVQTEPLQRGVAGAADVIGMAVDAPRAVGQHLLAELGRDHQLVADALDRLAEDAFVGVGTIGVGRIEKGDAEIGGRPDDGDGVGFGNLAVNAAQPHAAVADCGYRQLSEFALFHGHVRPGM